MSTSPWRAGALALLASLSLVACVSHPMGEDWEKLDRPQRTARALEVLEEALAGGVDGAGRGFKDRRVVSVDPEEVRYVAQDDPQSRASRLVWSTIEAVESQPISGLPSRPEDVYVYLEEASSGEVLDKITPALAHAGLARPYLLLSSRPRWTRSRMVIALQHLRSASGPAAVTSAAPLAPIQSAAQGSAPLAEAPAEKAPAGPAQAELDALEAKLERLRQWHERGLISDEDYAAKRRALLAGL